MVMSGSLTSVSSASLFSDLSQILCRAERVVDISTRQTKTSCSTVLLEVNGYCTKMGKCLELGHVEERFGREKAGV